MSDSGKLACQVKTLRSSIMLAFFVLCKQANGSTMAERVKGARDYNTVVAKVTTVVHGNSLPPPCCRLPTILMKRTAVCGEDNVHVDVLLSELFVI